MGWDHATLEMDKVSTWPQPSQHVLRGHHLLELLHFLVRPQDEREEFLHLVTFIYAFSIKYISANIQSP